MSCRQRVLLKNLTAGGFVSVEPGPYQVARPTTGFSVAGAGSGGLRGLHLAA